MERLLRIVTKTVLAVVSVPVILITLMVVAKMHTRLEIAQMSIPELVETLEDRELNRAGVATNALIDKGPNAVPAIADALPSSMLFEGYIQAIIVMRDIGSTDIDALLAVLDHENAMVRVITAEALGALGPEARDAVPALEILLTDDEEFVRNAAAEALQRINPGDSSGWAALAETVSQ